MQDYPLVKMYITMYYVHLGKLCSNETKIHLLFDILFVFPHRHNLWLSIK